MSRQRNIWRGKDAADLSERKAYVKARVRYSEVIAALNLDTDLGDECPMCGGFTLIPCADDKGAVCENPACGARFDMIKLVEERRDCSFRDAIEFLETIGAPARDTRTGDLFSGRDSAPRRNEPNHPTHERKRE